MPAADLHSFDLLLYDPEEHAARALRENFVQRGRPAPQWLQEVEQLGPRLDGNRFDALIVDLHAHRPRDLNAVQSIRATRPVLPIIGLSAPGPALRRLQNWNQDARIFDEILEKPVMVEALLRAITLLVRERRTDDRANRMAALVPEQGRAWAEAHGQSPVMSEAAILFTDVRRSTALASTLPAPALFDAINRSLTAQAAIVRRWQGSVVKFTGDGLLADFRGRGRAHFALRCALALQEDLARRSHPEDLPIGIGAAEGLVMKGLIGEPGSQMFDVIGATVHLAARLCAIAQEGEVVVTPRLARSAGLPIPNRRTEVVKLRGFDKPFECVFIAQPKTIADKPEPTP